MTAQALGRCRARQQNQTKRKTPPVGEFFVICWFLSLLWRKQPTIPDNRRVAGWMHLEPVRPRLGREKGRGSPVSGRPDFLCPGQHNRPKNNTWSFLWHLELVGPRLGRKKGRGSPVSGRPDFLCPGGHNRQKQRQERVQRHAGASSRPADGRTGSYSRCKSPYPAWPRRAFSHDGPGRNR